MFQKQLQNRLQGLWGYVVVLGLLWLVLFRELHEEWTVNPAYSYGWGVPVLGLLLLWKAWRRRPPPLATKVKPSFIVLTGLTVFYMLPILLVQEANPDWNMLDWLLATAVVQVTLSLAWYAGGWPWCRHFFVPAALGLLAVPWPPPLEQSVMLDLMQAVTRIATQALDGLGVAAAQPDKVIELTSHLLGPDEACSGLHSFPAALVMAMVVGELRVLSIARRVALASASLVLALGTNVIRITFLTLLWAAQGAKTLATWHDPAGYLTTAWLLGTVYWIGWRLAATNRAPIGGAAELARDTSAFRPFPVAASLVLASWVVSAETITWLWSWTHERSISPPHLAWTVSWPKDKQEFQPQRIPEGVWQLLRCDGGESGVWRRTDGSEWTMFFLKWLPAHGRAPGAQSHTRRLSPRPRL